MRLIDADEVYIRFCDFEDSISEADMDKISYVISSAPTAYDMDKVVEKLEKESYTTTDTVCGGMFKAIRLSSAIEIVKGGGLDPKQASAIDCSCMYIDRSRV